MATTVVSCPRCGAQSSGPFCSQCGAPQARHCPGCQALVQTGDAFCPGCGKALTAAPAPASTPAPAPDPEALVWVSSMKLPAAVILGEVARFLLITAVVMLVLMAFMGVATGEPEMIIKIAPFLLLAVAGLGALVLPLMFLFMGGSQKALFHVDSHGCAMATQSGLGKVGGLAQWAGILSGNAQLMGIGMLAEAEQSVTITWKNVHGVGYDPSSGIITLRDSWHTALRLFCPPDLYETVAARVRAQADQGRAWREAHGVRTGGGVAGKVGWLALVAVVTLVGLVYEPEENDVGFFVVLTGAFLAVGGLLPGIMHRGLGLFALLSGGLALLERFTNLSHGGDAILAFVGCLALVGLALYQMFRPDKVGRETAIFDSDDED